MFGPEEGPRRVDIHDPVPASERLFGDLVADQPSAFLPVHPDPDGASCNVGEYIQPAVFPGNLIDERNPRFFVTHIQVPKQRFGTTGTYVVDHAVAQFLIDITDDRNLRCGVRKLSCCFGPDAGTPAGNVVTLLASLWVLGMWVFSVLAAPYRIRIWRLRCASIVGRYSNISNLSIYANHLSQDTAFR